LRGGVLLMARVGVPLSHVTIAEPSNGNLGIAMRPVVALPSCKPTRSSQPATSEQQLIARVFGRAAGLALRGRSDLLVTTLESQPKGNP
jgi:hypothetical protein